MLILALAVSFTHGVASGDVTSTSAVLWTRVDREASLQVEVSPDPNFPGKTLTRTATATAPTDFTVKLFAEPLDSARLYYYRFTDGEATSDTGSFRTVPPRDVPAPVRFVFTGDSDGTRINGQPAYNQFEVLDAARRENPDFFIYLGDTIYADSDRRPAPART